jgi:deoxycytidylate deaminase
MIISDGYNGTPSGFENVCEDENNVTYPYVLHAEANAITKIARSNNDSEGATLYVTDSPCIECAKLIIQAGIKRVVYSRQYRLDDGLQLLKKAGHYICMGFDQGLGWEPEPWPLPSSVPPYLGFHSLQLCLLEATL